MDNSAPIAADVLVRSGMSTADEYDLAEAFATIGVAATTRLAPTQRTLKEVRPFR